MTTKAKAEAAEKATEAKRTTEKASDHFEPVTKVVKDAGPEGITLKALEDLTGIRGRVLHNVLYRLEKAEKVRRIQEAKGRKVSYASTEVKAARKRAPRKSTTAAKKATAKAA